jgi:lysophospholipase L1-like esterase
MFWYMKHFLFLLAGWAFAVMAQSQEPLTISLSDEQYKQLEMHFAEKEKAKLRAADWARFSRYEAMNDSLKSQNGPLKSQNGPLRMLNDSLKSQNALFKKQNKLVKVVMMGNSITEGWARIRPEFFKTNGLVGRGISGQTTSQMLVRFQADVIDLKPRVVVIMAGTNDIARNNGIISHKHILQNIQSMCELARVHKIRPVLCSILPADRFKWNPELKPAADVKRLNEMIAAYAREAKIPYVDFYSAMVNADGGLPADLAPDGVHPVVKGYEIMEPLLLKTLGR